MLSEKAKEKYTTSLLQKFEDECLCWIPTEEKVKEMYKSDQEWNRFKSDIVKQAMWEKIDEG